MQVVLVEPGKPARITDIPSDSQSLRAVVDGFIQTIYPWKDPVALVCNDEGKLRGLPLNRVLEGYDVIAGTFFICGLSKGSFTNLTDELAKKYQEKFLYPERIAIRDSYVFVFRNVGQKRPPEKGKNHDPER